MAVYSDDEFKPADRPDNELLTDKKDVLDVICEDWPGLEICAKEYRADKEIVRRAVMSLGANLEYASKTLRNDKEFILKLAKDAFEWQNDILEYMGDSLRDDADFFQKFRKIMEKEYDEDDIEILSKFIGDKLKKDKEFAKYLISKNGYEIFGFDDSIKNSDEFKKLAVQKGVPTEQLGAVYFTDEKEALAYIKRTDISFKFHPEKADMVCESLRKDKKFIAKAVKASVNYYFYCMPKELKADKDICEALVGSNYENMDLVPEELLNDEEFILRVAKKDIRSIGKSSQLLKNADFMLKAMDINPKAIDYASLILRMNKDFMLKAIKKNPKAKDLIPFKLQEDKEFMAEVAKL